MPKSAKPKVSITDVARAAGVSTATVDRVLNLRGGVRPDKEERIIETARALGLDRALLHRPVRTLRIGVMVQSPNNPFHAALREGFTLATQMYGALNIQLLLQHTDPRDHADTARRIEAAIGQRDGLIVSLPAAKQISAALRRFSGTAPVVTLATDVGDSGRSLFIGPDDHKGGRAAGDLMGLMLHPAGGEVLMIAGTLANAGQSAREAGFQAILAERHPDTHLVGVLETGEDSDTAGRMVEQALRQNPTIRGIYHTSTGAVQIVQALERMRRSKNTVVITHELTPNRARLLAERKLHAVIDQKPMLEARLAVEAMARLLGRLPGETRSITTEIQIFMPETA